MWRKTSIVVAAVLLAASVQGIAAASRPAEHNEQTKRIGTARAAAEPTPLPRLRSVTPAGQQYGRLEEVGTGRPFVPRGANYVRLTTTPTEHHSTFEPSRYTSADPDTHK